MKHTAEDVRHAAKPERKPGIAARFAAGGVIAAIAITTMAIGPLDVVQDSEVPPSPPREIVDAIKRAFERDSIPELTEDQVGELRRHFENDIERRGRAQQSLVVDTARGENHAKWMWKEHLRLIDPQDAEATIEGPSGLIRPVEGSQRNNETTLALGQWIARFEVGEPGVPERKIPPGVSYLLVIRLAAPITAALMDELTWQKAESVGRELIPYHTLADHASRRPLRHTGPGDPHPDSHDVPEAHVPFIKRLTRYFEPMLDNNSAKARTLAIHIAPWEHVGGMAAREPHGVNEDYPLGTLIGVIVPSSPLFRIRYNVMNHYSTGDDPVARALWLPGANDNACTNGCGGWCDFY